MKYATALLLLLVLLLAACGQKGPLFLPGEAPPAQQDSATTPQDDQAPPWNDNDAEQP